MKPQRKLKNSEVIIMKVLVLLTFLATSALALQRRYDGYQVFSVKAKDESSFNELVKLYNEQSSIYDFWTEPRSLDRAIDIMAPPAYIKEFLHVLQTNSVDYRVKIADVQSAIEASRKTRIETSGSSRYAVDWNDYYPYTNIAYFLGQIAQAHPDKVTVKTIGKTYENREMYMVKISTGSGSGNKKSIIIDGGIHAREWIASSFTTWLINELVENYASHPEYVDNLDWYILPTMNPDGNIYSFSDDRLWRKNRKPILACVGVDLNRNFGFHWNEEGAADLPCRQTYHGPSAFSEDESMNVRDGILSIASGAEAYLSFHSYGQYMLTPWGYTTDLPEDYADLIDLADRAVSSLAAVYGTNYTTGSSTNLLYAASGGSEDWAKAVAGIKYTYTVELRDTGEFGFLLPTDQIIPNHLEVWEAVKVVAQHVIDLSNQGASTPLSSS